LRKRGILPSDQSKPFHSLCISNINLVEEREGYKNRGYKTDIEGKVLNINKHGISSLFDWGGKKKEKGRFGKVHLPNTKKKIELCNSQRNLKKGGS